MALPVYTSQIQIPVERLGPRADPELGGAAARGLAGFGHALAGVQAAARQAEEQRAEEARQQAERTARIGLAKSLVELRINAGQSLRAAQETAAEGAPDFTSAQLEGFDAQVRNRLDGVPETLRDEAALRFLELRAEIADSAARFEAAARGVKQTRDVEDTVDLAANAVRAGAASFVQGVADAERLIEATGLPADKKRLLAQQAKAMLANAHVERLLEDDPQRLRTVLAGAALDAYLDPKAKNAAIADANREIEARAREAEQARRAALAERRAILAQRIDDAEAEIAFKGSSNLVRDDEIRAVFGKDAPPIIDGLRTQRELYDAKQAIALTSPAEDAALLGRFTPQGKGAAREARAYAALGGALADKYQRLARDPAGYAVAVTPGLRDALAAALALPESPEGQSPVERTAARNRQQAKLAVALRRLDETQAALGVPAAQRRAIPVDQAQGLVADLLAAKGEAKADAVQSLAERFGAHWPKVLAELQREKLPADFAVLATIADAPARKTLAEVMDVPLADLKKAAGAPAQNIDERIAARLAPLARSLARAPDGAKVLSDYAKAATRLALRYAATMDVNTAVGRATDEVALGRYDFTDTARAPKGELARVAAAADQRLRTLRPDQLMGVGDAKLAENERQALAHDLLDGSVWITNERDDGWLLLDAAGQPVLLKGGLRVELDFDSIPLVRPRTRRRGGPGGGVRGPRP